MWGLFGWHTVAPSALGSDDNSERAIILTEGEYDAMAAWQGLSVLPDDDPLKHIPVVSLPNGCNSLPTELIPLLDPFSKIYLWLDFDQSGQDACAKFVTKLGAHRCAIVKPSDDHPVREKVIVDAVHLY
jgi:twinkle protein